MTAQKIQKIAIEQLRPGMYVGNVYNDRGILLYCANTLIANHFQIEALRRQGVTAICVSEQKSTSELEGVVETIPQPVVEPVVEPVVVEQKFTIVEPFSREAVKRAVAIRKQTLDAVEDIMASARVGRFFSIRTLADSVEQLVTQMVDDPDLLLNLSQIRVHSKPTYVHSVNVAVLVAGFTSALSYSRDRILEATIGGILHDIGKVRFPEELLQKEGTCTRQEYTMLKQHPEFGLDVVRRNGKTLPDTVMHVIGQHHERLNGGGYPGRLRGEQIEEVALVCAIADMYDSLTTHGVNHHVCLPQEALALVFQGSDVEYPRLLVEHFTKLLGIYPVGSFVKLDSGEMGVVVKINRHALLTPHVKILFDRQGTQIEKPFTLDLSDAEKGWTDQPAKITNSLDPHSFQIDPSTSIMH